MSSLDDLNWIATKLDLFNCSFTKSCLMFNSDWFKLQVYRIVRHLDSVWCQTLFKLSLCLIVTSSLYQSKLNCDKHRFYLMPSLYWFEHSCNKIRFYLMSNLHWFKLQLHWIKLYLTSSWHRFELNFNFVCLDSMQNLDWFNWMLTLLNDTKCQV